MKVRAGFISNSSSSSFVVGYRGDREEIIESAGILSGFMKNLLEEFDKLGREVD